MLASTWGRHLDGVHGIQCCDLRYLACSAGKGIQHEGAELDTAESTQCVRAAEVNVLQIYSKR